MTDLVRLRSLEGVKWSKYAAPVLPAWVADMDFPPAPVAVAAIEEMLVRGDLGYNFVALDDLAERWCRWQERRHGWSPAVDETWRFTGAMHAVEAIMVLHTRPGDGVVILSPIYEPFRTAIVASGRRVVDVALEPGTWRLDGDRLRGAIDAGTRVILMCQPHNPTGRVFTVDELTVIAEVAERRDLLVISDEVWGDLVHPPQRHLPLALVERRLADRLITIGSASKTFNLAGLRCALAHVGSEAVRRSLRAFPPHLLGSPSSLAAAAAVAAWRDGEPWLDETLSAIGGRVRQLEARLRTEAPAVRWTRPEATYLAWLDFGATCLADDPAGALLRDAQVALEPGLKFGAQSGSWARLNVATYDEILDEVINRIVAALGNASSPPRQVMP